MSSEDRPDPATAHLNSISATAPAVPTTYPGEYVVELDGRIFVEQQITLFPYAVENTFRVVGKQSQPIFFYPPMVCNPKNVTPICDE
jgi:hypothetical protein